MGEHDVEQYFSEIKRSSFGSNVAVVDDVAAHDGDARTVRILLWRAELTHCLRDGDSFAAIVWDLVEMDNSEVVGDFDALYGAGRSFAYALAPAV